jgi:hypothetical protein
MVDNSERYPQSGTGVVPSGNANPQTILNLRDEATLDVEYIKVEYGGGATAAGSITLYDESDGTNSGNLGRDIEGFELAGGADRAVIEDPSLDSVERDIIAEADGTQDADVRITIGGTVVTG